MIPALIFVLAMVWMQLVKGETKSEEGVEETKKDLNFEQAYQVIYQVFSCCKGTSFWYFKGPNSIELFYYNPIIINGLNINICLTLTFNH